MRLGENTGPRQLDELLDRATLGARVLTLTGEVRDLQLRFSALEGRFAAMESRFSAMEIRLGAIERRLDVQEERMSAMLAVIVRIAERLDRTTEPPSGYIRTAVGETNASLSRQRSDSEALSRRARRA